MELLFQFINEATEAFSHYHHWMVLLFCRQQKVLLSFVHISEKQRFRFAENVSKTSTLQSTLALRTPRYYGHPNNTDSS